jgi:ParB family chromosome partitioning protein
VTPGEAGKFEVDAGGRRLPALRQLEKSRVIDSLLENVQRVEMDAMDEVEAYAALIAEGATPSDVAQRCGVTRRHVDQRLALAGLPPKIQAAWKRGGRHARCRTRLLPGR